MGLKELKVSCDITSSAETWGAATRCEAAGRAAVACRCRSGAGMLCTPLRNDLRIRQTLYKTTGHWYPGAERAICRSSPKVGIEWSAAHEVPMSAKDRASHTVRDAETFMRSPHQPRPCPSGTQAYKLGMAGVVVALDASERCALGQHVTRRTPLDVGVAHKVNHSTIISCEVRILSRGSGRAVAS